MNSDQIFEVITKLIGQVNPYGDSAIDKVRFENMETFIKVFDKMHDVIDEVAYKYKDSKLCSIKKIADLCNDHLTKIGIVE